MHVSILITFAVAAIFAAGSMMAQDSRPGAAKPAKLPADTSIHTFATKTLDGKPATLADYKGKVLLVVNTASKCGLTPQYTALEKLQTTYEKKGFSVLGFPCNDFGGQEPGSATEIQTFCSTKYNVTFPLFSKIAVKGDAAAPLYHFLTMDSAFPGPITWNFEKFLIGTDGKVLARFAPKTTPDDPKVLAAIDEALKAGGKTKPATESRKAT
jgi:glutathione peroxidase